MNKRFKKSIMATLNIIINCSNKITIKTKINNTTINKIFNKMSIMHKISIITNHSNNLKCI